MIGLFRFVATIFFVSLCSCQVILSGTDRIFPAGASDIVERPKLSEIRSVKIRKILANAQDQTHVTVDYTQKYFAIPYPNGDVPAQTGACTDVVIRSFRAAGLDLQKQVHEDMTGNFAKYPSIWGLKRTDTNIDHRRVPNLRRFFERKGKAVIISLEGAAYRPGDVISWDLNGRGLAHIGIVSNMWNKKTGRYLIIHNIGGGTRLEDRMFDWKITGHYRYF